MAEFIVGLGPKGVFIFGVLSVIAGYVFTLIISKSHIASVMGVLARVAFGVYILFSGLIAAETVGDIAFNLSLVISSLIFIMGAGVGLYCVTLVSEQLGQKGR